MFSLGFSTFPAEHLAWLSPILHLLVKIITAKVQCPAVLLNELHLILFRSYHKFVKTTWNFNPAFQCSYIQFQLYLIYRFHSHAPSSITEVTQENIGRSVSMSVSLNYAPVQSPRAACLLDAVQDINTELKNSPDHSRSWTSTRKQSIL